MNNDIKKYLADLSDNKFVQSLLLELINDIFIKQNVGAELFFYENISKITHIRDWITSIIESNEEWKTPRVLTLDALNNAADKYFEKKNNKIQTINLDETHEKLIVDLGDYYVVQMLTPEALDNESKQMHHCVGHGYYDQNLNKEEYKYLSLRDKFNKAHATVEIKNNEIMQLRGKQNKVPDTKYLEKLLPWLIDNKYSVDFISLGYYFENNNLISIKDIVLNDNDINIIFENENFKFINGNNKRFDLFFIFNKLTTKNISKRDHSIYAIYNKINQSYAILYKIQTNEIFLHDEIINFDIEQSFKEKIVQYFSFHGDIYIPYDFFEIYYDKDKNKFISLKDVNLAYTNREFITNDIYLVKNLDLFEKIYLYYKYHVICDMVLLKNEIEIFLFNKANNYYKSVKQFTCSFTNEEIIKINNYFAQNISNIDLIRDFIDSNNDFNKLDYIYLNDNNINYTDNDFYIINLQYNLTVYVTKNKRALLGNNYIGCFIKNNDLDEIVLKFRPFNDNFVSKTVLQDSYHGNFYFLSEFNSININQKIEILNFLIGVSDFMDIDYEYFSDLSIDNLKHIVEKNKQPEFKTINLKYADVEYPQNKNSELFNKLKYGVYCNIIYKDKNNNERFICIQKDQKQNILDYFVSDESLIQDENFMNEIILYANEDSFFDTLFPRTLDCVFNYKWDKDDKKYKLLTAENIDYHIVKSFKNGYNLIKFNDNNDLFKIKIINVNIIEECANNIFFVEKDKKILIGILLENSKVILNSIFNSEFVFLEDEKELVNEGLTELINHNYKLNLFMINKIFDIKSNKIIDLDNYLKELTIEEQFKVQHSWYLTHRIIYVETLTVNNDFYLNDNFYYIDNLIVKGDLYFHEHFERIDYLEVYGDIYINNDILLSSKFNKIKLFGNIIKNNKKYSLDEYCNIFDRQFKINCQMIKIEQYEI